MQNLAKHRLAQLALAIVLVPTFVSAQTLPADGGGTLDAGFGTGGTVTTDFGDAGDQAFSVAVQLDGRIVAAGQAVSANLDFALARYQWMLVEDSTKAESGTAAAYGEGAAATIEAV